MAYINGKQSLAVHLHTTSDDNNGLPYMNGLELSFPVHLHPNTEQGGGSEEPEIPTSYTITNNLTNCTNRTTITSIKAGGSYLGYIIPDVGYTLSSLSVTIGGSPLSGTNGYAYILNPNEIDPNDGIAGVVRINNVTGDIVITASAIEESGGGEETVSGQLLTADGLYFMTADNEEFITKESANG